MRKTTVYLPDELKQALERRAQETGRKEADLIRDGVRRLLAAERPIPRIGLFAHGNLASRVDEVLAKGFGRD